MTERARTPPSAAGTEHPRLIALRCHHVLSAAAHARAAPLLPRAHAELQARAQTIADSAQRHSFLACIPHHREIVALHAASVGHLSFGT